MKRTADVTYADDLLSREAARPEAELVWAAMIPGREFPTVSFTLTNAAVDTYLDATGEAHLLYEVSGGGFVPPLFTTMVRLVQMSLGARWPNGTIQLAHRIRTFRPLCRGERLSLAAHVHSVETKGGRRHFEIMSRIRDAQGATVAEHISRSMWGSGFKPLAEKPASGARVLPPTSSQTRSTPTVRRDDPLVATFTLESLRAFGKVAGALDPIHVDPEFARMTRYGANIAPGRLVTSMLSRLMLAKLGKSWLHSSELDVRFVGPAIVGEPLFAYVNDVPNGQGYALWCETADGSFVMTGFARVHE